MTKQNENVRPPVAEHPDFVKPKWATDHAANAAKEKAAKAEAIRRGGYRDLTGRRVAVEKYFHEDTSRVPRVIGPMRKGENGNIAPAIANDPTRRAESARTQWPDPMRTSQGGNDYIPVTSLAGWSAGATEAVMNAGITLAIRQGMLCIALTDVARAMWVLQTTFGTPRA